MFVPPAMPRYKIAYRYVKGKHTWEKFNYLREIRHNFYFIIKNATYFKIFVLNKKGDKYISLCNKYTFMDMLRKKVVRRFCAEDQRAMLMKNMRFFKQTLQDCFDKGYKP